MMQLRILVFALVEKEGIARMFEGIAKLLGKTSSEVVDAIVRQVAELSVEGVCGLVETHVEEMSLSEARGYVRARAVCIVRQQTRAAISRHPKASEAITDMVVRAATERILPTVLRQAGVGVPRRPELLMAA